MRVLGVLIRNGVNFRVAGSERSFAELSNALTDSGVQVDAVEVFPSVSGEVASRFNSFVLGSGSGRGSVLVHTLLTLRIALSRRCQIVFTPTVYWSESIFAALCVHLILRKPLFVGLAGPFLEHQDKVEMSDLFKQMLKGSRGKRVVLTAFLRRLSVRASSAVLVPTTELAVYATNTLGARRAVVIRRGVDDFWFESKGLDDDKKFDAIFVGRLHSRKGVDVVLDAWVDLCRSHGARRLAVVGSGPLEDELIERSEVAGIRDCVTFTGWIRDEKEIRRLLHSSRLLLLPSEGEGFARVAAEAMACGVPCILSDLPGLRELYGEAAVFVPRRNPAKLAQAISQLLLDEGRRQELGKKSLSLARTFRWSTAAAIAAEAFDQALRDRSRHQESVSP